jgi:eukaryotic-like serine/threonine-protein kinase
MNGKLEQSPEITAHLSAIELQLLLSDDDASGSIHRAALHLESCETCQSKLTTFAGGPDWWHDAHTLLSSEIQPRWEPDLSRCSAALGENLDSRDSVDDRVLQLLGMPKHPEMLGRLGRYDIEKIIGSGGMGIVLKAHDSELNRPIAIKLLAPHLSHVGAARERFAREGRAAAAVVHEHVVAIYNVEADGTLPFLTMQYVPGHSLQARVDENGPLGVEEILRIGLQAASGLAAAHAHGLVHRDVKPSNILLEETVERAILTDFGLARAMDDASLTQTGIIAGTPHYMSPEQASGEDIDARSDLFSLGSVMYFMSTGHPPFRAASALAVLHRICREQHRPVRYWNKNVPDELADIIDRLLEKRPSRRFASAEEVRQRLARLLSQVQQYGPSRCPFSGWRCKRGRRKLFAAMSLLATAALAIVVAIWIADFDHRSATTETTSTSTPLPTEPPTGSETEFFTNLDVAKQSLIGAARDRVYLRGRDDLWHREIESLQRELIRIESNNH